MFYVNNIHTRNTTNAHTQQLQFWIFASSIKKYFLSFCQFLFCRFLFWLFSFAMNVFFKSSLHWTELSGWEILYKTCDTLFNYSSDLTWLSCFSPHEVILSRDQGSKVTHTCVAACAHTHTHAYTHLDTHPCDSLDSSDNLEQQFSKTPWWEARGGVLYAQTQKVGRCELMVIPCEGD